MGVVVVFCWAGSGGVPATVCRRVIEGFRAGVLLDECVGVAVDSSSLVGVLPGVFGGSFQGFCGPSLAFCCAASISCICCCCSFFRSFWEIFAVKLLLLSRRAADIPRLRLETRFSDASLMISRKFFFEPESAEEPHGIGAGFGETESLVFFWMAEARMLVGDSARGVLRGEDICSSR